MNFKTHIYEEEKHCDKLMEAFFFSPFKKLFNHFNKPLFISSEEDNMVKKNTKILSNHKNIRAVTVLQSRNYPIYFSLPNIF